MSHGNGVLWGTPNTGNFLVLFDQNGVKIAQISGRQIVDKLAGGGAVPNAANILVVSGQPYYSALLWSRGADDSNMEVSNVAFDNADHCN